ncbi:MAG: dihydroorotate dehydrogenase electron transfer subunit [Candidatus Omnitrophica bacterium]|nr:dihydroorotate dehydrogenase electron transfer subunit [Candidatus Omnitrophota bacterium]
MGKILQLKAKLIYNKRVSGRYLHLAVEAPKIANVAKPGQFIEVRVSDGLEPFLRRPFSVHSIRGGQIEILYEVFGRGTEVLSQRKPEESLDIIGPLGNGFDYKPQATGHRLQVLVAGGMGVAPLTFLAERLKKLQAPCLSGRQASSKLQALVLIGAKTKKEILCEKEFQNLGCEVKIATDDGSRGFKGYVSNLLIKVLSTVDCRQSTIYACGPKPMLKEIARVSKKYNIPAQISLEEHMACGIGACLGCVVNTKNGYQRVCKEGPVFDAEKIIW